MDESILEMPSSCIPTVKTVGYERALNFWAIFLQRQNSDAHRGCIHFVGYIGSTIF